jgi:hypothetical protein
VNVASEQCCDAARTSITLTAFDDLADYPATDAIIWYFAFHATDRGVSLSFADIKIGNHLKSTIISGPRSKSGGKE